MRTNGGVTRGVLVIGVLAAAAAPAHAQDDEREPRLVIGGSAVIWVPQSDADDTTDTSIGVRPQVTYWITPFVGVTGTFDWVFVNEESGVGDVTYYTIGAGARVTLPRPMRIKPYGELVLGWHVVDAEGVDESDLGFRFGGGATYAVSRSLVVSAGLGYSTVELDAGFGFEADISAFVIDVGIAARL
jgi:hypothetical protein